MGDCNICSWDCGLLVLLCEIFIFIYCPLSLVMVLLFYSFALFLIYFESQPGVRWTITKYSEVDLFIMLIVPFSMEKENTVYCS